MAKTRIQRLREPSLKLVDSVTLEMTTIAREVVTKVPWPPVRSWSRVFGWSPVPAYTVPEELLHAIYF